MQFFQRRMSLTSVSKRGNKNKELIRITNGWDSTKCAATVSPWFLVRGPRGGVWGFVFWSCHFPWEDLFMVELEQLSIGSSADWHLLWCCSKQVFLRGSSGTKIKPFLDLWLGIAGQTKNSCGWVPKLLHKWNELCSHKSTVPSKSPSGGSWEPLGGARETT